MSATRGRRPLQHPRHQALLSTEDVSWLLVELARMTEQLARMTEQRADARLHFEIAMRTFASGLPVDWGDACIRIIQALSPEGEGLDQLGGRITFRSPRSPASPRAH